jgi:anti-sigma B factor antagonist
MMNEPTTLTSQTDASGVIVLQFHGDLDSMGTHTVEAQFDAALDGVKSDVVVDMADVGFISSAGMAMLLVRGKKIRQRGGSLLLAGASTRVLEVLSLAGFHELFNIYPTVDEAVASLEPSVDR